MKKYYRVKEAAELIGVSASTLRRYEREGRVESARNPGGQRIFTREMLSVFLPESSQEHVRVFYVRASDGDKKKLDQQEKLLERAYGEARVYSDKASGLNENRRGLQQLLKDAKNGKFSIVSITQKDRLTRFGYSYLETLFSEYGVKIEILGDHKTKTLHDELLEDFMSLIASFSGKYYRLRGHEQKKKFLEKAGEELA